MDNGIRQLDMVIKILIEMLLQNNSSFISTYIFYIIEFSFYLHCIIKTSKILFIINFIKNNKIK